MTPKPSTRHAITCAVPPLPLTQRSPAPAPGCTDQQALWRRWQRHARRLGHSALLWLVPGLLWCGAHAAAFDQAEIRQPRASFIDVAARTRVLRAAADQPQRQAGLPASPACGDAPPLLPPNGPMVIPPRYRSGNHGPVNPHYDAAVAHYRAFEDTAARLANAYVASADPRQARCLLDHLHRWAQADALLEYQVSTAAGASNQAWYQAEWSAAAAALALSQVLAEPSLDAARVATVIDWLHRVSRQQSAHPGGVNTCCNNHAYWRGLHATMVGVLANDPALFRWGLGRYTLAIDHLAADGSWPLEMARQEQSLHYQNFALLPLVMIAEIAAQQGIDLYAYKSATGQDLHSAVRFLAALLPAKDRQAAIGLPEQDLRGFASGRGEQAWGEFYRARFGVDPLGLLGRPSFNARTGGDARLLAHRPAALVANAAPAASPSANAGASAITQAPIDLRPWKLQLPDAQATDIAPARLAQGYRDSYFEVEPGGSLLFTAPVGGGTTATAKYTRSELREMLDPNDKAINWTAQGHHRMTLREEVLQPPRSGRVVVFQIHAVQPDGGAAPPLVKAQWRDGTMQFLVKALAIGGRDIVYEVPGVPLRQAYDASLAVDNGVLTMQLNGHRFTDDFVARDPGWLTLRYYFKAGNYPQDKDAGDGGNLSVVRIHALKVTHD